MALDYKRPPRPTGINNRINEYYQRRNHVRIAKNESSRSLLLAALTPPDYAENGFIPKLITDYENENYFVGENAVGFFDIHAHTATSPMTMRDDDGLLKWGPHNAVKHSADLAGVNWGVNSMAKGTPGADGSLPLTAAATGSGVLAFYAENTAQPSDLFNLTQRREIIVSKPVGVTHVLISANNAANGQWFNIEAKTVGSVVGGFIFGGTLTDIGGGRLLLGYSIFEGHGDIRFNEFAVFFSTSENTNFDRTGAEEITVEAPRGFLADLPMVNNPDRGDQYVPTDATAVYLPRRGHNPTSGKKGVLIEPKAATNIIPHSNDFSNASWTKTNSTATANAIGPDGVSNGAWTVQTTTEIGYLRWTSSQATSTTYTTSIFAKAGTTDWCYLRDLSVASQPIAWFDLTNGTVGTVETGLTALIEDWGSGWYRCSITGTSDNPISNNLNDFGVCSSDNTRNSVIGESVEFYGAQLEEGSVPSSYIPTQGAAETRDAETLEVLSTALAYDAAAMSFAVEGVVTYADNNIPGDVSHNSGELMFWRWWADTSNYIGAQLSTSADGGAPIFASRAAAVRNDTVIFDALTPGVNTPFSLAGYTVVAGDIRQAVDGDLSDAQAISSGLADLSSINLSLAPPSNLANASNGPQTIALFRQWDEDIGDRGIFTATGGELDPILDRYAANGFFPPVIADFENEVYAINNSGLPKRVTFSEAWDHAATSLMTMRDGGLMKWGPHNALINSDWAANWTDIRGLIGPPIPGPTGSGDARVFTVNDASTQLKTLYLNPAATGVAGWDQRTLSVVVSDWSGISHVFIARNDATEGVWFDLESRTATPVNALVTHTGTITELGNGALLLQAECSEPFAGFNEFALFFSDNQSITWSTASTATENITVADPSFFRSSLGGIANNPETGSYYVPTSGAVVYLPRRGHVSASGKKGILIESAAATNSILYSNDFSDVNWIKSFVEVAVASQLGPDGNASLWDLEATGASNCFIYDTDRSPTGAHTVSAFIHTDSTAPFVFLFSGVAPTEGYAAFDTSTLAINIVAGANTPTASVEDWGNGLYRISATWPATAGANQCGMGLSDVNNDITPVTVGTKLFAGFFQIEAGSVPSSYIPTENAEATRNAETLQMAGSKLAYSAAAMSFAVDATFRVADDDQLNDVNGGMGQQVPFLWKLDASNFIEMAYSTNPGGVPDGNFLPIHAVRGSTVRVPAADVTQRFPADGQMKPYKDATRVWDGIRAAHNGELFGDSLTGVTMPDLTATNAQLFPYSAFGDPSTGEVTISLFRQWNADIEDAGLVEATT